MKQQIVAVPHATVHLVPEGDLKPPGCSPASRPLARSVALGEEPAAQFPARGKE